MKSKLIKFALPIGFGLVLAVISVLGLVSISLNSCNSKKCTDSSNPLYCESAKTCCPSANPYNDGHGTCFSTMAGCRAGGYACEVCHIE